MVWYQKFEYAIGHWLQKAAEHMLGCVLCSPGCFSLFRGSAIMDDNVMRTYATKSTTARHYVQYDQGGCSEMALLHHRRILGEGPGTRTLQCRRGQKYTLCTPCSLPFPSCPLSAHTSPLFPVAGEDRWLCTLLLQQGYKVEYCAAADASTFAPETFREYFNQRRRWIPSTLANMMDLLSDYHRTVLINDNISYLYMVYQAVVMGASLLAPATVVLMVAGAIHVVVGGALYWLWLSASIGAAVAYMLVCFRCAADTQITVAGYMSTFYAVLMLAVTVGIVVQTAQDTWTSPNAMFIIVITGIFTLSGFLHPEEFMCLIPGAIYFLCIPAGFLLLFIYSMINMNVVSWGTREIPSAEAAATAAAAAGGSEDSVCTRAARELQRLLATICCCIRERCTTFIEERASRPAAPAAKRDEIVAEILAQLGRMEAGENPAAAPAAAAGESGASDLRRQSSVCSCHGGGTAYESAPRGSVERRASGVGYGGHTAGGTTSLMEERQRSIVRQLDSIHRNASHSSHDYPAHRPTTATTTTTTTTTAVQDKFKDAESMLPTSSASSGFAETSIASEPACPARDDLVDPRWMTDGALGRGVVRHLDPAEVQFWRKLIDKYLEPIRNDAPHRAAIVAQLRALRNNAAFLFFMLNFLWLFVVFLLQVVQDQLKDTLYIRVPRRGGGDDQRDMQFEPLSVAFLVFFALIITIQFVSMLFHRYGTFLHILASANLRCCVAQRRHPVAVEDIVETVKLMQRIKGIPHDDDDDRDNDDDDDDAAHDDYDILGGADVDDPDVVSCGAQSTRRRRPTSYSSKTLRGAFVKRYNALSKRSARNKPRNQRPAVQQVFDNVAYQDDI